MPPQTPDDLRAMSIGELNRAATELLCANGGDLLATARALNGKRSVRQLLDLCRRKQIPVKETPELKVVFETQARAKTYPARRSRAVADETILKALETVAFDTNVVNDFLRGAGHRRIRKLAGDKAKPSVTLTPADRQSLMNKLAEALPDHAAPPQKQDAAERTALGTARPKGKPPGAAPA